MFSHAHRNTERKAVLYVVLGLFLLPSALQAATSRPNVVLIMTDDMGYGDLGFHGNPVIDTPHIDAMAKRSSLVRQFYVSPVCAPTRACLMTGRYNYRTRAIDTYVGRAMMEPAEFTIAEALQAAGYATGIFGKWHLGDCYPMRPMDQGFGESLIHHGGGIGQPSDPPGGEGKYTDPILFKNGAKQWMKGYCTDLYYSAAMEFIGSAAKAQQPFFVYLPDNCPHGPFHDVPEADYARYKKKNLQNDQFPFPGGHPLPRNANVDQRARIFAMITNVDRNIGRLFAKLDELNITDNTIVVFMVDNGPNGRRYVAGMKGAKSMVHEGGVRSPFFIQWPQGLAKRSEASGPFAHIDVMPTLLDACGVSVPQKVKLDGVSFLPALRGAEDMKRRRPIVIQSHRGDQPQRYHNFMIRMGDWKLLNPSGFGLETMKGAPQFELYNLAADPLELNNLAKERPDEVARLKKSYDDWFDDVSSTRPDNYAPPRIVVGTKHEPETTLTRQDWRHEAGRPWARDSLGHWLLTVREGVYQIDCRFAAADRDETLTLAAGDVKRSVMITAGDTSAAFDSVKLSDGHTKLELQLTSSKGTRGVHQTDLRRSP